MVCISSADGAAAERVGPLVAERLGFRLVDEEVVARAAEEAGVGREAVADVERRKSVVARLLEQLPSTAAGAAAMSGYVPLGTVDRAPRSDALRGLIRSALEELASRGEAVIVAHAASHALSGRENALRVLVTGSAPVRAARIAADRGLSEEEAAKLCARGDANRADYLKRFYGVPAEEPAHYDLVVNTDRVEAEQAADLIAAAARA